MIDAMTLATLLHVCAQPLPAPLDLAEIGVVSVESGTDAWAMHDNNTGRSYYPKTFPAALRLEADLIASDEAIGGRGIDVGIAQIDSHNFKKYGLTQERALHACDNLEVSAQMLASTYDDELHALITLPYDVRQYAALDRTLQIYNSGQSTGDDRYTVAVETAAQSVYASAALAHYRAGASSVARARAAATPDPSCFAGCSTTGFTRQP